jgi:hypothetical protein
MKKKYLLKLIPSLLIMAMIAGCIIDEVTQPEEVETGEAFVITLDARTTVSDANEKYGIVGIFLPADFEIDSVIFTGTMSSGSFYELMNDSTSLFPGEGGIKTGWSDKLAELFGEQEGYVWRVYETEEAHSTGDTEEHSHEITIYARAGSTTGEFGLGYVVTESALDFTDESMWGDSFDNMITVKASTSIENPNEVVSQFTLDQNYPNPFNPVTTINYTLQTSNPVTLDIVDVSGRVVKTLVQDAQVPGNYSVVADMSQFSSGVYIYRLTVNNEILTRKMTLVK